MKSAIIKFTPLFSFIILALSFVTSTSCNKDKTCYGTVKVTDSTGSIPVAGASVNLAAPSVSGQVTYDAVTDGGGEAKFEIKLPAIFDITATSGLYPGKTGKGTLRCDEPGKKTGATVKLI